MTLSVTLSLLTRGQHVILHLPLPALPDSISLPDLASQIEAAPDGIPKVRKLLALVNIYREHGKARNLDTCIDFSRRALNLSARIHDTDGSNEALHLLCEAYVTQDNVGDAAALLPGTYGEERARLLLNIAEHFVDVQPLERHYLDQAWPWLSSASQLTDTLGSLNMRYECLMLLAKYYFEHDELEKGKQAILGIIDSCRRHGDIKGQANYWSELNIYMPLREATRHDHEYACRQSIRFFEQAGDHEDALFTLRDLAENNVTFAQLDSAEAEYNLFLKETQRLHITPSEQTCFGLGYLYLYKGDLDKALDYSIRSMHALNRGNYRSKRFIYYLLAEVYGQADDAAEELNYARLAVDECVAYKDEEVIYGITANVIHALIRLGRPQEALDYLHRFIAANPARSPKQKEEMAYNFASIYNDLGDPQTADRYFREVIGLEHDVELEDRGSIYRKNWLYPFFLHVAIGKFYVDQGKFLKAKPFLEKALTDSLMQKTVSDKCELERLFYKTDSATGDLRSALVHFARYKTINDSLFGVARIRQLQKLQVQFNTQQKEQSIRLLESESRQQATALQKAAFARNTTLAGIGLFFALAAWAFFAYRAKQRNVRQLKDQQEQINRQYVSLERLLSEKNVLLGEKDMLLREVHHRVRNNLHIVSSLLGTQSLQVKNRDAKAALLDSQNRIQAISMLHQKLYGPTNLRAVGMVGYIRELTDFLSSTLDAKGRNIKISYSLDPVYLDISHAMPVGMILNEAITNAIKHAFTESGDRMIGITLRNLATGEVRLQIRDNGRGLPPDFDKRPASLGMSLLTGLGNQLEGKLTMENQGGLVITIVFVATTSFTESTTAT